MIMVENECSIWLVIFYDRMLYHLMEFDQLHKNSFLTKKVFKASKQILKFSILKKLNNDDLDNKSVYLLKLAYH